MPNQEKHFSVFKFATNIYMDLKNSRACFTFISFLKLPLYVTITSNFYNWVNWYFERTHKIGRSLNKCPQALYPLVCLIHGQQNHSESLNWLLSLTPKFLIYNSKAEVGPEYVHFFLSARWYRCCWYETSVKSHLFPSSKIKYLQISLSSGR